MKFHASKTLDEKMKLFESTSTFDLERLQLKRQVNSSLSSFVQDIPEVGNVSLQDHAYWRHLLLAISCSLSSQLVNVFLSSLRLDPSIFIIWPLLSPVNLSRKACLLARRVTTPLFIILSTSSSPLWKRSRDKQEKDDRKIKSSN